MNDENNSKIRGLDTFCFLLFGKGREYILWSLSGSSEIVSRAAKIGCLHLLTGMLPASP